MNNKRTLYIAAVAVLVVILSVAASLIFPGSTINAQPIPVTGRSSSGVSLVDEIAQQNLAANSRVTNKWESPIEEYIRNEEAQVSNPLGSNKWESPIEEYMRNEEAQVSNLLGSNKWESPIEEYIRNEKARVSNTLGSNK